MKRLVISLALVLSACASASVHQVETPAVKPTSVSVADRVMWDMVSLTGLEARLRAYHAKGNALPGAPNTDDFQDVDFKDFSKVSASLYVQESDVDINTVRLAFSGCNGIWARYDTSGDLWRRVGYGTTAIACERAFPTPSGKFVAGYTPMIADTHFTELSLSINGYKISEDGKSLTLLDANDDVLGLFTLREATP